MGRKSLISESLFSFGIKVKKVAFNPRGTFPLEWNSGRRVTHR